jgi:hypothetical protein
LDIQALPGRPLILPENFITPVRCARSSSQSEAERFKGFRMTGFLHLATGNWSLAAGCSLPVTFECARYLSHKARSKKAEYEDENEDD